MNAKRHPLETPIQYLKGVGPVRSEALASLDIHTIEDLLYLPPRRYVDRTTLVPIKQLKPDTVATVLGRVTSVQVRKARRTFFSVSVRDDSGTLTCLWFKGYQYLKHVFKKDDLIMVSGKVTLYHRLQMTHPDYEILSDDEEEEPSLHMGRIIPIYPSTGALSKIRMNSKTMRKLVRTALDTYGDQIKDTLPPQILKRQGLVPLAQAMTQLHFPDDDEQTRAARQRLSFNELFMLGLLLAIRKNRIKSIYRKQPAAPAKNLVEPFLASLPYQLTAAQERVVKEILADMGSASSMNRLLQGDVGSGKTLVALCAVLKAVENGFQAALMVPTEVLAEQHFITMHQMLKNLDLSIVLVTGAGRTKAPETLSALATGRAQIIIGTHALFQEGITFKNLGLIIVDEQHKFGVMQRTALYQKGSAPDVLVMTATPIPRTLSLTVYGDLDVSVIDEMPPGRGTIKTAKRLEKQRPAIYSFIEQELHKGHQAYIVYPLIEESEKIDLESAIKNYEIIRTRIFPQFKCSLLHGRMSSEEKEQALLGFKNNDIRVLVSTTVIEVGVDVPNATVMLIEHGERFGLAQLHQLRGRIGRGADNATCILCVKTPLTFEASQRLKAITSTTDGFRIAELDLEIRGPGEFLGTRQHGLPNFKMANLLTDTKLLVAAREEAFKLIGEDPTLQHPNYGPLRNHLKRRYRDKLDLLKIG